MTIPWEQSHLALTTERLSSVRRGHREVNASRAEPKIKDAIDSRGNQPESELQGEILSVLQQETSEQLSVQWFGGFFLVYLVSLGLFLFCFLFFILSGNRLRFLWTKSKRTHSCNTAVVV